MNAEAGIVTSESSEAITRKAKSNLALALACLPPDRKRDMISFYAFCRVVDDIADDPAEPLEQKKATLARWRHAVLHNGEGVPDPVMQEVVALPGKYDFNAAWLAEIIDGVASDQDKDRYATIEELLGYCYKVASVVGLVSARIFGARDPQANEYAIALGYALQLTNIMRDVGEDARETRRIYLPLDELERFGVTETEILQGRPGPGFHALMEHQYQRARGWYEKAESLLPRGDRHALISARMMATIYHRILEKLHRTGYRVFERRERLSKLHKGFILGTWLLRGALRLG